MVLIRTQHSLRRTMKSHKVLFPGVACPPLMPKSVIDGMENRRIPCSGTVEAVVCVLVPKHLQKL